MLEGVSIVTSMAVAGQVLHEFEQRFREISVDFEHFAPEGIAAVPLSDLKNLFTWVQVVQPELDEISAALCVLPARISSRSSS